MKCRPTSRCTPRQPKRGWSLIRTPATLSGSPVGAGRSADGGSSWRRVWVAQFRPRAVAAVSSMPASVTSTTYASSARLSSLIRRRAPSAVVGSSKPVPGDSSRRTTAAQPGSSALIARSAVSVKRPGRGSVLTGCGRTEWADGIVVEVT